MLLFFLKFYSQPPHRLATHTQHTSESALGSELLPSDCLGQEPQMTLIFKESLAFWVETLLSLLIYSTKIVSIPVDDPNHRISVERVLCLTYRQEKTARG